MSKRMTPADRKASVLAAAVTVAMKHGFTQMRLAHIAAAAECSNATVVGYYSTMTQLRRAVMREAIRAEILPIIANGIATGDPTAKKAAPALRDKAIASLAA